MATIIFDELSLVGCNASTSVGWHQGFVEDAAIVNSCLCFSGPSFRGASSRHTVLFTLISFVLYSLLSVCFSVAYFQLLLHYEHINRVSLASITRPPDFSVFCLQAIFLRRATPDTDSFKPNSNIKGSIQTPASLTPSSPSHS